MTLWRSSSGPSGWNRCIDGLGACAFSGRSAWALTIRWTHLYDHADPRLGYHPEWHSRIFNYGRLEVRNFLMNSGLSWLDRYHIDGLRVDAVASMLYLDYGRKEGEWIPNRFGGHENIGAVTLLKDLNVLVHRDFPAR